MKLPVYSTSPGNFFKLHLKRKKTFALKILSDQNDMHYKTGKMEIELTKNETYSLNRKYENYS